MHALATHTYIHTYNTSKLKFSAIYLYIHTYIQCVHTIAILVVVSSTGWVIHIQNTTCLLHYRSDVYSTLLFRLQMYVCTLECTVCMYVCKYERIYIYVGETFRRIDAKRAYANSKYTAVSPVQNVMSYYLIHTCIHCKKKAPLVSSMRS